jgi:hypothetical protein
VRVVDSAFRGNSDHGIMVFESTHSLLESNRVAATRPGFSCSSPTTARCPELDFGCRRGHSLTPAAMASAWGSSNRPAAARRPWSGTTWSERTAVTGTSWSRKRGKACSRHRHPCGRRRLRHRESLDEADRQSSAAQGRPRHRGSTRGRRRSQRRPPQRRSSPVREHRL